MYVQTYNPSETPSDGYAASSLEEGAYISLHTPHSVPQTNASPVQGAGSCRAAEVWGPPMAVEGLSNLHYLPE